MRASTVGLGSQTLPERCSQPKIWMRATKKTRARQGKNRNTVATQKSIQSYNPGVLDKLRTEADYFERNAECMRYPKFRRQHSFGGPRHHRSRLQNRNRLSSTANRACSGLCAELMPFLALRCCHLNGRRCRLISTSMARARPGVGGQQCSARSRYKRPELRGVVQARRCGNR